MTSYIRNVSKDLSTFCGFPRCPQLDDLDADVVIIGIPYESPYEVSDSKNPDALPVTGTVTEAPATIRRYSRDYTLDSYDFDFGGDPLAGSIIKIIDCGDIILNHKKQEKNLKNITNALKKEELMKKEDYYMLPQHEQKRFYR